jgi:hypothetical protein
MINEKRTSEAELPDNALGMLTEMQRISLRRIENFGWTLKFIRHPSFEPPLVVVENSTGISVGVLDEDGGVDMSPKILLRN